MAEPCSIRRALMRPRWRRREASPADRSRRRRGTSVAAASAANAPATRNAVRAAIGTQRSSGSAASAHAPAVNVLALQNKKTLLRMALNPRRCFHQHNATYATSTPAAPSSIPSIWAPFVGRRVDLLQDGCDLDQRRVRLSRGVQLLELRRTGPGVQLGLTELIDRVPRRVERVLQL